MSSKTIDTLNSLLQDPLEHTMYITGGAGRGKTEMVIEITAELTSRNITYAVTAYTHDAKDVLRKRLTEVPNDIITTTHSFLKKCPTINKEATKLEELNSSCQYEEPDKVQVLIVDEFSYIGSRDYSSILELQEPNMIDICTQCNTIVKDTTCSNCNSSMVRQVPNPNFRSLKVIFVGDEHQGQPVKDCKAIIPKGKYLIELTHNYRVDPNNKGLADAVDIVLGKIKVGDYNVMDLPPFNDIYYSTTLVEEYKRDTNNDKMMYAYTNRTVQLLNSTIQGRLTPVKGDTVYSHSIKKRFTVLDELHYLKYNGAIRIPSNKEEFIYSTTKYNPISRLDAMLVKFKLKLLSTSIGTIYVAFGSHNYKTILAGLESTMVAIADKTSSEGKRAYAEYKLFTSYVFELEFIHCKTIHKSQGTENAHVYLDRNDLDLIHIPYQKATLWYVGISRARKKLVIGV